MKRILIDQPETIDLSDIDDRSFIGIQWESGTKCMVINTPEGYCSISDDHMPNTVNVWLSRTAQDYVKKALTQGNNTESKAFEFNNVKELYAFMADDKKY